MGIISGRICMKDIAMKTLKYFILIMLVLSTIQVSAQLSLGITGGYTKAWEDYGDVSLPEDAEIHIAAFNFSALVYFPISNHVGVGVDPGFIQRGAACIPGWNGGINPIFQGDTKLFLSYVAVPLMISGQAPIYKEKFEVFGKVGYGPSYLTAAIQEETILGSDDPPIRSRVKLDDSSNLNRWDHGFYGSLGIGYHVGVGQLFIESGYYLGLKNADRFNASKNRNVNFNLGYLFKL